MSSDQASLRIQRVPSETLFPELSKVSVFTEMKIENLECLGTVELIEAEVGAEIAPPGTACDGFYVVLQGEVEVRKEGKPGEPVQIFPQTAGESFGEMPLLKGVQSTYSLVATAATRLVRFDEEAFWQLMFSCPRVRAAILGNMARRLESYQVNAVHREKLASLGTLAAGLMHELNNPGAAALRAASQLRENLARMQEIGLRFTSRPRTQEQLDCMNFLQQQAMRRDCCVLMGSLKQSDREEALAEWLEKAGSKTRGASPPDSPRWAWTPIGWHAHARSLRDRISPIRSTGSSPSSQTFSSSRRLSPASPALPTSSSPSRNTPTRARVSAGRSTSMRACTAR